MAERRRRLLVLGGVLAALPAMRVLADRRPSRIGVLLAGPAEGPESRLFLRELREGLRELGGDRYVLVAAVAVRQLLAARCDILVSETSAGARALQKAAGGTPIVVAAALEAPSGPVTGLMRLDGGLDASLVALAHELLPRAKRLCFVCDPSRAHEAPVEVPRIEVRRAADVPRLAERLAALQGDALVVAADARLFALREAIVREALAAGIPAFGPAAEFAELGALASYGCDVAGNFRAAARYVDRLLKGAQPAELSVEPPSRFELVLNLKTARALHLELPPDALLRADRVIE